MLYGEKFNTITHLLAALVALPGIIFLIIIASQTGDVWKIISASIYGVTLVLLYVFSTLYHAHTGRFKKQFQKLDHLSIYLLIAGTYTPYMLVTLRGVWGWSILGIVWGLALIGIIIDLIPKNPEIEDRRLIQLVIYLIMGWLIIIPLKPLAENLASNGVFLLGLGGLLYTVGVIFFVLDEKLKHAHGIWHLFVIGGSVSHFSSIYAYVM